MKASSAFSCVVNPPGGMTTCSSSFGFEVGVEVSRCLAEYAAKALLLLGLKCSGLEDRAGGVGLLISSYQRTKPGSSPGHPPLLPTPLFSFKFLLLIHLSL